MPKLVDNDALEMSAQGVKAYIDKKIDDLNSKGTGIILLNGLKGLWAGTKEEYDAIPIGDIDPDIYYLIKAEAPVEPPAPTGLYVTFDSDSERTITPVYNNTGVTLQYSLDKENWDIVTSGQTIPAAKNIYMRGQATGTKRLFTSNSLSNKWVFSGTADNKLRVTGNLNSLLCDAFGDETAPTAIGAYCYARMFQQCTMMVTAPELPATTLGNECYATMFTGSAITTAPELPATTMAYYCYSNMFVGCKSLVNPPALPAMTLAELCYNYMFDGCTALATAPALPATTLAKKCYDQMFTGCTSLINAPELPATILVDGCYSGMFYKCTSLVTAPELPAVDTISNCYGQMFSGCSTLNSLKIHAVSSDSSAVSSILYNVSSSGTLVCKAGLTTATLPTPAGWTRVNF